MSLSVCGLASVSGPCVVRESSVNQLVGWPLSDVMRLGADGPATHLAYLDNEFIM